MEYLPVGNDIVDRKYEQNFDLFRFARRVLSAQEYEEYLAQSDRRKFLWLAWSAKESVYKYLKQIDPTTKFLPSKYEFCLATSRIRFAESVIAVWHLVSAEYIYCSTAKTASFSLGDGLATVDDPMNQHQCVRNLAQKMIARLEGRELGAVFIGKKPNGIPYAQIDGSTTAVPVSFTHHGRFAACAVHALNS